MRRCALLVSLAVLLVAAPAATRDLRAQAKGERPPQVWAVIIGIDRYDDEQIPKTPGATADARVFEQWLIGSAGWQATNILRIYTGGNPKPRAANALRQESLRPSRENLDFALKQWLKAKVEPGDIVVLFYAGQAAYVAESSTPKGVTEGRPILIPSDIHKDQLALKGWSPEEGLDALASLSPHSVITILDTSLHGRGQAILPPPLDPSATKTFLSRLARWRGTSAWIAADGVVSRGRDEKHTLGSLTSALASALGTEPKNLRTTLNLVSRDPTLQAQNFRMVGGLAPDVTLWQNQLRKPEVFRPKLLIQQGHAAPVTAIATGIDGQQLATASDDSTVRLWRRGDRKLLRTFADSENGVTALALSPDGKLLASGDGLGKFILRDLTRSPDRVYRQAQISPHRERLESIVFLSDGNHLASLDASGEVFTWDTSNGIVRPEPLLPEKFRRIAAPAQTGGSTSLIAVGVDGRLRLFGTDIKKVPFLLEGSKALPTALATSPDGKIAAVGDETGTVIVYDLTTRREVARPQFQGGITQISIADNGSLAIGSGNTLNLFDLTRGSVKTALDFDGSLASAQFSIDGKYLAALAQAGEIKVWNLNTPDGPRALPLAGDAADFRSIAFLTADVGLVAGEASGGFRTYSLPDGVMTGRVASHRGRVRSLAVNADPADGTGRDLLQITDDGYALLWDLKEQKENQTVRTLPGRYLSGAFVGAEGKTLALSRVADEGGDVILLDRESGLKLVEFPRPKTANGRPSEIDFDRVVVSRDGRKVAGAAAEGRTPILCVWDADGKASRTFRDHDGSISALEFSLDGKTLFSADTTGRVILHDLEAEQNEARPIPLPRPAGTSLLAARLSSSDRNKLAISRYDSGSMRTLVELWTLGKGAEAPVRASLKGGEIEGRIPALSFSADGRWLAASGENQSMSIWKLQTGSKVRIRADQFHDERVTSMIAWPNGIQFVSGSDDSTIRFWYPLDPRNPALEWSLLGALSAAPPERKDPVGPRSAPDWIAFTPEGKFDASLKGENLVSFIQDQEVRELRQYFDTYYQFGLGESLRLGQRVTVEPLEPRDLLTIDPPRPVAPGSREVSLRISLKEKLPPGSDLRLYHNHIPIQGIEEFVAEGTSGTRYLATARLRGGDNLFYAMASTGTGVDAQSSEIHLAYDAPEDRGRLHVIALGISDYLSNPLKYAVSDADSVSSLLQERSIAGNRLAGETVLFRDKEVTEEQIEEKLGGLRKKIKGHPEDTVVLFLAGHTGIVNTEPGNPRFSLLKPDFPFPKESAVAGRGLVSGYATAPDKSYITYVSLARQLAKMDAQQRLIIIDACQAESILHDSGVLAVQKVLEKQSRKVKSSYLLAARRGEAAFEADDLKHGLLTYVLLRGLKAERLETLPQDVPIFQKFPTADLDADGTITTTELREYTDLTLPSLAQIYPREGRGGGRGPETTGKPPRRIWLRGVDASFPIIEMR